jgi:hypothetical protein
LICRWIDFDFDADERIAHFEDLLGHIDFNRMTRLQLACSLRHPLVRANSPAFIQITDALVSRINL